ncbi:MAG: carboxypeptidase regulatory-like domain-containing protein, partial [candidate division Zixibacteria bacterium]
MRRLLFAFILCCTVFSTSSYAADYASPKAALRELKATYPGADHYADGGRITRIYGQSFGTGSDPVNTAERFRSDYAEVFGVDPDNLIRGNVIDGNQLVQPVMYNRETGEYKFTMIYYSQYIDGIPVYMADLRLLVRNESGYPLVLAASALRNLGDFDVDPSITGTDPIQVRNTFASKFPNYTDFSEPRMVVWAGIDDMKITPATGVEFIASDGEQPTEKMLYIIEPVTGEVLYEENLIIEVDVSGHVDGNATDDFKADFCGPEVSTPLPYSRVYINSNNPFFADENGDFVIPNGGSSPVTVYSHIRGQWFRAYNTAGSDAQLTETVTPPGPADFLHNFSNSSEFNRAEVNAYFQANIVRDFTLTYNPSYPVINSQTEFPVYVNRTDGYCPGNAWYDGGSINFCQSGSGYPNTAFADIVHHEYGHHLVAVAGSGQGQYGEGMSDVMALLITDSPYMGLGFFGNCNGPLRNADNNIQYPCSGPIHDCGQLISGCVWDTREALAITNPVDYIDILSNIAVNAILLHTGENIDPSITIDYLTLDDDDGDIGNGTPHFDEITAGFGAHNMWAGPPPENDDCINAVEVCPGVYSGSTSNTTNDGSSSCGDSNGSPDLWYKYTPATNGTLTVSGCSGTSYDMVLSLHTGCPGTAGNEIDCDDDGCGPVGGPSIVSASVAAGVTYYIRVTGWSGSSGGYTINITGPECEPQITGTLDGTVTDGTNPIGGVSVYADDGAGHTGTTTTIGDGTYSLDLAVGTYTVTYSNPSYETVVIPSITIYENTTTTQDVVMSPLPVSDIDVSPTQITGIAPPGSIDTEILTISNFGPGSLVFVGTASVNEPSPGPGIPLAHNLPQNASLTGKTDSDNNYVDIEKPPFTGTPNIPDPNVILQGGDNIGNATVITSLPYNDAGTTSGYANDYDEICPYSGSTSPDVVYAYTPGSNQMVDITLCNGSAYDTKLYVYENSAGNTIACNDDTCPGYV